MDTDEVRLQATEVIQQIFTTQSSIFPKKVLRHENFRWLTAHTPILGENNGHPSGLGLFENDIAIVKVNGTLPCKKKEIWPACLPTPVSKKKSMSSNSGEYDKVHTKPAKGEDKKVWMDLKVLESC